MDQFDEISVIRIVGAVYDRAFLAAGTEKRAVTDRAYIGIILNSLGSGI